MLKQKLRKLLKNIIQVIKMVNDTIFISDGNQTLLHLTVAKYEPKDEQVFSPPDVDPADYICI